MKRRRRTEHSRIEWRRQSPTMEIALAHHYEELLERGRVAAEVDARTGGRCYYPGCTNRIISYPHAVPIWEGGVHSAINRAGVCGAHRTTAMRRERGSPADLELRDRLQRWLIAWYGERGVPPETWRAMATGRPGKSGAVG